jgi:hypothetical protein
MPSPVLRELSKRAERAAAPVLLVANKPLPRSAEESLRESENIEFSFWRSQSDDDALEERLREMFAQMP